MHGVYINLPDRQQHRTASELTRRTDFFYDKTVARQIFCIGFMLTWYKVRAVVADIVRDTEGMLFAKTFEF